MYIPLTFIINTCFITTLLILILGILNPKPHYTSSIKIAFFTRLPPSLILSSNLITSTSKAYTWLSNNTFSLFLEFRYDTFSIVFTSAALLITYNIVKFSQYYMASDPQLHTFRRLLNIFLLSMIILISANNLFQLLIGWEGVGFLSFLLIGW